MFGPVAESDAAEESLARQLLADSVGGRLELAYVDPGARWLASMTEILRRARRAERRSVLNEIVTRPPYVAIDGDWERYLAARTRKFVKDLRRLRRRLAERGEVEVTMHSSAEGLDDALAEFVALEASGWKERAGTAISSRDASRRFYADIARWAAERDWLRLAFLRLDGRAIAAELDLECAGGLYALKSGFDPEYRAFGPGQMLTHDCLEWAFAEGLSSYEFLGTDEPYKMHWTDTTHSRARVRSFRRTVSGDLSALARHHARPLVRRLRRR
jgi:CelD/BcsL family acetyltransferase involved in cellulose biosynthesis